MLTCPNSLYEIEIASFISSADSINIFGSITLFLKMSAVDTTFFLSLSMFSRDKILYPLISFFINGALFLSFSLPKVVMKSLYAESSSFLFASISDSLLSPVSSSYCLFKVFLIRMIPFTFSTFAFFGNGIFPSSKSTNLRYG